jgi:hypothetical protein
MISTLERLAAELAGRGVDDIFSIGIGLTVLMIHALAQFQAGR